MNTEKIPIDSIDTADRMRVDYNGLPELCKSISEVGLIQPIILSKQDGGSPKLVVGGRRLKALISMKVVELEHQIHFLWTDEQDPYLLKVMELEENLKRRDLTWQEQVQGKAQLLSLMQSLKGGPAVHGGRTLAERRSGEPSVGFGVRSLAAMLGESVSSTSRDLKVAEAIKIVPSLAQAETKESAVRKLNTLSTMIAMAKAGAAKAPEAQKFILYEGDFQDNVSKVADESVDLVFIDIPFGVDLDKMSKHG